MRQTVTNDRSTLHLGWGLGWRAGLAIPVVWLAALALRFGFIENEKYSIACDASAMPVACSTHFLLTYGIRFEIWGWIALLCAALCVWRPSRRWAVAGVCAGVAGLVLYGAAPAAIGFVVSVCCLARRGFAVAPTEQHAGGEA